MATEKIVPITGVMCVLYVFLCYHLDLSFSPSAFITPPVFISVIPMAGLCIITV